MRKGRRTATALAGAVLLAGALGCPPRDDQRTGSGSGRQETGAGSERQETGAGSGGQQTGSGTGSQRSGRGERP